MLLYAKMLKKKFKFDVKFTIEEVIKTMIFSIVL